MLAKEEIDAKKQRYGLPEALELLDGMTKLFVAKGKKYAEFDLKNDRPSDDELGKVLLGPTGNLRAPTFKVGKILVVGFNEELYEQVFG